MKLILRILAMLCYFLPFTFFVQTCVGPDLKSAFNKHEAEANKQAALTFDQQKHRQDSIDTISASQSSQPQLTQAPVKDTLRTTAINKDTSTAALSNNQSSSLQSSSGNFGWKLFRLWDYIKMPTEMSLSGIGTMSSYKNLVGRILIGISFLFSLVLLLSPKVIGRNNRKTILLASNIVVLLLFLVVSLISSVSLLYGFWALLIIQFIQLYNKVVKNYD